MATYRKIGGLFMKDALMRVLKAAEVFEESLSSVMFYDKEDAMQKLMDEFDTKNLELENFEKMLRDFTACLVNVPEDL